MKTIYRFFNCAFGSRTLGLIGILLLLSITACEKELDVSLNPTEPSIHSEFAQNIIVNDTDNIATETATTLSYQLPNPYTVANMRQAYQNLYGGNWSHIVATHQYVRFKPTTIEQLLTLVETLDLDLFDEPLDYKLAQEGDYYQDPNIHMEQVTWQYTVVPTNFGFPSGIQYEVLASIHIPTDTYVAVEAEAERLVGLNADGDDYMYYSISGGSPDSTTELFNGPVPPCEQKLCNPGYVWDNQICDCAIDETSCQPGYVWSYIQNTCIPLPPVATQTIGNLSVHDTQLGIQNLRNVRVVAKRWFKIERMYTNTNGRFNSTKRFGNKVKLVVKFKNNDASIRSVRGIRVWQILLPVQKKFGPLQGSEINDFTYTFTKRADMNSKGTRNWVAATTHNAVPQFKDLSIFQGTGNIPANLKIVLTNWAAAGGKGSAPLFSVRWDDRLDLGFVDTFIALATSPIVGGNATLVSYLKRQFDISYGYNVSGTLTSDKIVATIFHELAHASLYNKAGTDWYKAVVDATIAEISGSGPSPYGTGNTANSAIIALNEAWGNHYGHFLAHQRYGNNSSEVNRQGESWESTHLLYLEYYNPSYLGDSFRWIPEGIFLDMIDNTPNEINTKSIVDDQVHGFTNSQLFRAIESDVRSPQAYKNRLLQQTGSTQTTQVTNLFTQYGYF